MHHIFTDERASATGTLNFVLAIGAGAVIAWIFATITAPIFDRAETVAQGDPVATTAIGYAQAFVDYWPALAVFTAFFSYLALAVFRRELGV